MKFYGIYIFGLSLLFLLVSKMQLKEIIEFEQYHSKQQLKFSSYLADELNDKLKTDTTRQEVFKKLISIINNLDIESNYSKVQRKPLVELADSLNIDFSYYESNYSLILKLVSYFRVEEKQELDYYKIVVHDVNYTNTETAKLSVSLCTDSKFLVENLPVFHRENKLELKELMKYEEDLNKLTLKVTSPHTNEEATIRVIN
jgi:hypothetical protein